MKKFFARFALIGLFAGLVATSYSLPAQAATSAGSPTEADEIIIIIIGDDYLVVWVELGAAEANAVNPGALSQAVTDGMFNQ